MTQEPNPVRPPSDSDTAASNSAPVEPGFIKVLVRVALISTLTIPFLFVLVLLVSYDVAEVVFAAMIAASIVSLLSSLATLISSLCLGLKKQLATALLLMVLCGLTWAIAYPALLGGHR